MVYDGTRGGWSQPPKTARRADIGAFGVRVNDIRALRRELRRRRRLLSSQQRKLNNRLILRRLRAHPMFRSAKRIAIYLDRDGEVATDAIRTWIWGTRRLCFLPVLKHWPIGTLAFAQFTPASRCRANRFGIPEPTGGPRHALGSRQLDLILVPLVGFDASCNRIGMGGGYYDRTLKQLNRPRRWRRPRLLGLAHECQRVEVIEPSPWDVRLDGVVTEREVYRPRQAGV